jgi:hypothetical protein
MEFPYKLQRALALRPEILTLGSSRANQFRGEMFPGATFYNAAGASHSFEHALAFLTRLFAEHRPRLVILTIDPWWFRHVTAVDPDAAMAANLIEFSYRRMVANAITRATDPKFLLDLIRDPASSAADPLAGRIPVGYRAARSGDGYRPDGSVQYGGILRGTDPYYHIDGLGWQRGFAYFERQIRDQLGRFSYTGPISSSGVETLRRILELCREQDVAVLLVLPPLAHHLYRVIQDTRTQRDYFARVEEAVAATATPAMVEVHNFHDLGSLGVSDRQTIDGVHGDEIAYLALVAQLALRGGTLRRFVDVDGVAALRARMQDPANRLDLHRIAP